MNTVLSARYPFLRQIIKVDNSNPNTPTIYNLTFIIFDRGNVTSNTWRKFFTDIGILVLSQTYELLVPQGKRLESANYFNSNDVITREASRWVINTTNTDIPREAKLLTMKIQLPVSKDINEYMALQLDKISSLYEPRNLTSDEINYILSDVKEVIGRHFIILATDIRDAQIKSYISYTYTFLSNSKFKLSPISIDTFRYELRNIMGRTFIRPESNVGMMAADAMAGPITQAVLNTFHKAGSASNAAEGIEIIKEFLNLSARPKSAYTQIAFTDESLTFNDVYAKLPSFEEVILSTVVQEYYWHRVEELTDTQPWLEAAITLYDIIFPERSSHAIRLDLNPDMLYRFRLTPRKIATVINNSSKRILVAIPSPTIQHIVDVYVDVDAAIKEAKQDIFENDEATTLSTLTSTLVSKMDSIIVSGIKDIHDFTINHWLLTDMIKGCEASESKQLPSWNLYINLIKSYAMGTPNSRLEKLLSTFGIKINKEIKNGYEVSFIPLPIELLNPIKEYELIATNSNKTNSWNVYTDADIKSLLVKYNIIGEEIKGGYQIILPKVDPKSYLRNIYTNIELQENKVHHELPEGALFRYYYATVRGSNLPAILIRNDVLARKTFTTNHHEMAKYFGIEVARSVLEREAINILNMIGEYISPAHYLLTIDFMTRWGFLTPTTYHGITKGKSGPLVLSTTGNAFSNLTAGAIFGGKEPVNTVTGALFVGAALSTNFRTINETKNNRDELLKTLKANSFSATDTKSALVSNISNDTGIQINPPTTTNTVTRLNTLLQNGGNRTISLSKPELKIEVKRIGEVKVGLPPRNANALSLLPMTAAVSDASVASMNTISEIVNEDPRLRIKGARLPNFMQLNPLGPEVPSERTQNTPVPASGSVTTSNLLPNQRIIKPIVVTLLR